MKRAICIATMLLWATAAYAAGVAEVKASFDAGDYPGTIREADKILVAEPALTDAEAYQLIMLKAEAMLRGGSRAAAGQEFAAAADMAPSLEQLAWARSTRLLLSRATGNTYVPKSGEDKTPIDIIDTASRKRAFAALLQDLRPAATRAFENAMKVTTLPQLEDAILPVSDAAFLEVASTGQTGQMMPMLNDVGKHAQQLIAEDIIRIQRQVSHAGRLAAQYDEWSLGGTRGISSRERDQLAEVQGYLERVNERVQMYRDVAMRLGGDTAAWDRLLLQIIGLQTDVTSMLRARY